MDQRDPIARIERLVDNGAHELLIPRTDCGMVAATGSIKNNKVIIFASDATKQGGALGADGARVIVAAYKAAMKEKLPIIGIWHSGGARLREGVLSLDGVGRVFAAMTRASGKVPQISVVVGPAAGGAAYGPGGQCGVLIDNAYVVV